MLRYILLTHILNYTNSKVSPIPGGRQSSWFSFCVGSMQQNLFIQLPQQKGFERVQFGMSNLILNCFPLSSVNFAEKDLQCSIHGSCFSCFNRSLQQNLFVQLPQQNSSFEQLKLLTMMSFASI